MRSTRRLTIPGRLGASTNLLAGFAALTTQAATGNLFAKPETMLEVVEGTDTGGINRVEATEDGEERDGAQSDDPVINGGITGQGHAEPAPQQVAGVSRWGATLGFAITG